MKLPINRIINVVKTDSQGSYFGTAAWTIPKEAASAIPGEGTHLERYARVFRGVEINSSFYREHKASTYKKWADSVPEDFRFSVKLSKVFTHLQKLQVDPPAVREVLSGIQQLGPKWGALLVQLPPSLAFDEKRAHQFFKTLREEFPAMIAFEPRHETWAEPTALKILKEYSLTKVFADPEPCLLPEESDLNFRFGSYFRLHGTPVIYKSNYTEKTLQTVYEKLSSHTSPGLPSWCIFDNTTFGFATLNALRLEQMKGSAHA